MGNAAVITGPKPLSPPIAVSPPQVSAPQGASSGAVDEAAMSETLTRLRADGSYQFDFTNAPPPPEPPAWLRALSEWLGSLFGGMGPVFTVIFWAAVVALIAFLLYMLVPAVRDWVDALLNRRRTADEDEASEDWRPSAEAARNLLAEADALAAQGRYGDAVHLLLGRSLEDIDRRRPGLLKPAMTARVIAVEPALPPPARSAFAELAATVERALFALREISAGEWQTSRAAYERFALREQWAGAAT
jgi:hypothetical protein